MDLQAFIVKRNAIKKRSRTYRFLQAKPLLKDHQTPALMGQAEHKYHLCRHAILAAIDSMDIESEDATEPVYRLIQ